MRASGREEWAQIGLTGDTMRAGYCSRFLRTLFEFSKRPTGEAAELCRRGVKYLDVVGAVRLECGEPAAEARELVRRQLGNCFGDFLYFHVPQCSMLGGWLRDGEGDWVGAVRRRRWRGGGTRVTCSPRFSSSHTPERTASTLEKRKSDVRRPGGSIRLARQKSRERCG